MSTDHHNLGAKFCRQTLKNGGVCIYVHESLIKQDLTGTYKKWQRARYRSMCGQINLPTTSICIIFIYILRTGNLHTFFFKGLDKVLNLLCSTNIKFIICGDININYLVDNCKKRQQLDTLLASYNLNSSVHFQTSPNGSDSARGIFTYITNDGNYSNVSFY